MTPRSQAFTLIELLVSMAIFALLLAVFTQMVGGVQEAVSRTKRESNALMSARWAMDRIQQDLLSRPPEPNLPVCVQDNLDASKNDAITFYTQAPGLTPGRSVSYAGYSISPDMSLERGVSSASWQSSGSPVIFPQSPSYINPDVSPRKLASPSGSYLPNFLKERDLSDHLRNGAVWEDKQTVGEGIFRMEIMFLNESVSNSALTLKPTTSPGYDAAIPTPPDDTMPNPQFNRVAVVTLAAMDTESLRLLTTDQLQVLASLLPDGTDSENTWVAWSDSMAKPDFGTGLPPKAISSIRIFQRQINMGGLVR